MPRDEVQKSADWRHLLITRDKSGAPRPLLANAITAFRSAPEWEGLLWFDAFHQRTMLRGRAPWSVEATDEGWSGTNDILAADWLQRHDIYVSPDVAGQAIETVARDRRFHPVINYLERCRWDGAARLDSWAIVYLGAEDTPYCRAVSRRWMISAVARVMEPGCKADCALILEGPQGLLKSTALKTLGHPWFTDDLADLGTKDAAMQLAGRWILELAELDSISRGEVSKIKAFMSRTTDRFRPPYGRRVVEQPRQCVFAGTVNNTEYLRDETGGRRFWPIECSVIDIEAVVANRDQLWAEARDRYLAREPWWLDTPELNAEAAEEQSARYQEDPWQEVIEEFAASRSTISVGEILKGALFLPIERWGQSEQNRVARCLRKMGWERFHARTGQRREWRYRPPVPVSPVRYR